MLSSRVLLALAVLGAASAEDYTGDQVLRVANDLPGTSSLIRRLGLSVWSGSQSHVDVMVPHEILEEAKEAIENHGNAFSVMIEDVEEAIRNQNPQGKTRSMNLPSWFCSVFNGPCHHASQPSGRMSWDAYHRLDTIYSWMSELAGRYPKRVSVGVMGNTTEGRQIKYMKISSGRPNAKGVLIDGGVHAREWVSPASVTWIMNELVEHWDTQPAELRQLDWYIVPVLNPDGYEYTHTNARMWRKNRSKSGSGPCQGVDVNRNYDAQWMVSGSSDDVCTEMYAGPSPHSELESKAITKLARSIPRLKAYMTFHSYSQIILLPFSHKKNTYCADYNELKAVAQEAVQQIRRAGGPNYEIGTVADIMYPASGGSIDYMKTTAGVKYSYGVELRDDGTYGFLLPASQIRATAMDAYLFVKTVAIAASKA